MDPCTSTELVPLPINHEGCSWPLWRHQGGQEPLAKDLDVARWLEYQRPRYIRELITRYSDELGGISPYHTAKFASDEKRGRGRPEAGFLLTEAQVLFLVAKSETPKATALLKTMIAVFMLARRGLLAPDPSVRPEAPVMERLDGLQRQITSLEATIRRMGQAGAPGRPPLGRSSKEAGQGTDLSHLVAAATEGLAARVAAVAADGLAARAAAVANELVGLVSAAAEQGAARGAAQAVEARDDGWLGNAQAARYIYGRDGAEGAWRDLRRRHPELDQMSAGSRKLRRWRRADLDRWLLEHPRYRRNNP